MSHELRLRLVRAEGVLVRVLGLVVRRGFEPVGVHVGPTRHPSELSMTLVVEGARPVALLARQLSRLYDVHAVEVVDRAGPPATDELDLSG